MTVKELIEALKKCKEDSEVFIEKYEDIVQHDCIFETSWVTQCVTGEEIVTIHAESSNED